MRLSARLGAEFVGTFVLVFGGTGSAVLAATFLTPLGADTGLGIGFAGVCTRVWTDGPDDGVRGRSHLGRTLQSGDHPRAWPPPGASSGRTRSHTSSRRWSPRSPPPPRCGSSPSTTRAPRRTRSPPGASRRTATATTRPASTTSSPVSSSRSCSRRSSSIVIMGTTDKRASKGFAALAIGLALTLIHLVSIPVTNTSVNPARSTGPAILLAFGGESWGLEQLWLFWLAPDRRRSPWSARSTSSLLSAKPSPTLPSWASTRPIPMPAPTNSDRAKICGGI